MSVKYAPGNEPENIRKRLITLFAKLDEAYPDKLIFGLYRDHKKWGETVTELYRILGYESNTAFLNAYGYQVTIAEPKAPSGRVKEVDGKAIIDELKRRYPNGTEFSKADDLFAANPDFASKQKTLSNQANEMFGMPLGKYLKSIGLLKCMEPKKVQKTEDEWQSILDGFVTELRSRLEGMEFIPTSCARLDNQFPNMDFAQAGRCVKHIYRGQKTLDEFLQEKKILRQPESEREEAEKWVDWLRQRYSGKSNLPKRISELIQQNPDIPVRKLNKYLRANGIENVETYYIKHHIMQGKETDLIEYYFCDVYDDNESIGRCVADVTKVKDLKEGDAVIVAEWDGERYGFIKTLTVSLGIDAPYPVSTWKYIARKVTEEDRKKYRLFSIPETFFETHPIKLKPIKDDEKFHSNIIPGHFSPSFMNAEIRGFQSQIVAAKAFILEKYPNIKNSYPCNVIQNRTETPGIYELVWDTEEYNSDLIDQVMEKFPELKIVAFFESPERLGGGAAVYACYSAPGYPYVTKNKLTGNVSHCDEEIYTTVRHPTEDFETDIWYQIGDFIEHVVYKFPFKKEWKQFDYLMKKGDEFHCVTGIRFPEEVTAIPDDAYFECKTLESITVPKSMSTISPLAFNGCSKLQVIKISEENPNFKFVSNRIISKKSGEVIFACKKADPDDEVEKVEPHQHPHEEAEIYPKDIPLENISATCLLGKTFVVTGKMKLYENREALKQVISAAGGHLASGVTPQTDYLINNDITSSSTKNLTAKKLHIPIITEKEFAKMLKKGDPKAKEKIEKEPTSIATPIEDFKIVKGELKKYLGDASIVAIPDGIKRIGKSAFSGKSLKKVIIPDSVTEIGAYAFNKCKNLTGIELSDSITVIENHAFAKCSSLASVVLPHNISAISDGMFSGCVKLKDLSFLKNIVSLGEDAFRGCTGFEDIIIPDSVIEMGEGAFVSCEKLKHISLPSRIKKIERFTFAGCTSLKEIVIPDSVEFIGNWAFSDCIMLSSIHIPKSVTFVSPSAFNNCRMLPYNDYENGEYLSVGDNPFFYFANIRYCEGTCKLHPQTNVISWFSFFGCHDLENIIIPSNVRFIGDPGFWPELESVSFANPFGWRSINMSTNEDIPVPSDVLSDPQSAATFLKKFSVGASIMLYRK